MGFAQHYINVYFITKKSGVESVTFPIIINMPKPYGTKPNIGHRLQDKLKSNTLTSVPSNSIRNVYVHTKFPHLLNYVSGLHSQFKGGRQAKALENDTTIK